VLSLCLLTLQLLVPWVGQELPLRDSCRAVGTRGCISSRTRWKRPCGAAACCFSGRGQHLARPYRINGAMPIEFIRRGEGNDLEVAVMRDRSASWILTVRQDGGTWRAVSVAFAIA